MRKSTATAALVATALCLSAGVSSAEPTSADKIDFTSTVTDKSTVIRTDGGSMVVEDGVFKIKAANGIALGGTELSFRVDDFVFPIAAEITDRTATLTPQLDLEHATYKPVALPYEDQAPWRSQYDREQAAWSRMASTITMGATVGTVVGGIAGAGLGCLLGGAVGLPLGGALGLMFGALPGAVLGCIAGMAVAGFLGTIAGALFVTAPAVILAAAQYFTTINQPFTPPATK
ncbi:hypothetical protein [Nocardia sp. CA-135398]|uniref:hypothetical protein n=1 Tax=Nocardia sp. CA-135398 TaxID=3239977 RepID=UPI003D98730D